MGLRSGGEHATGSMMAKILGRSDEGAPDGFWGGKKKGGRGKKKGGKIVTYEDSTMQLVILGGHTESKASGSINKKGKKGMLPAFS